MAESKPRDLTAAELELLKGPMQRGSESVPLAVPPGTRVPVHLLDPTAADAAAVSRAPSLEPPGAAATSPSIPKSPNAPVKKRGR
jgi:hypothetical protein